MVRPNQLPLFEVLCAMAWIRKCERCESVWIQQRDVVGKVNVGDDRRSGIGTWKKELGIIRKTEKMGVRFFGLCAWIVQLIISWVRCRNFQDADASFH
jgi:hypothetical protein